MCNYMHINFKTSRNCKNPMRNLLYFYQKKPKNMLKEI